MDNKQNLYKETRDRITRFKKVNCISDKEIIEKLAIEIQQYRDRIKRLNDTIDKLLEEECKKTKEDTDSEDIEIIESIIRYSNGKPTEQIVKYNYKEDIKNG